MQKTTAKRTLSVASAILTAVAALLGLPLIWLFVQAAMASSYGQSATGINPGYGEMLGGMLVCVPWLPIAIAAVATNYRNLAAWASLIVPPLVVFATLIFLEFQADAKTSTFTVSPVHRAGANTDDMHPMIVLETEKERTAVRLDDGDQPISDQLSTLATADGVRIRGALDVQDEEGAFDMQFELETSEPMFVRLPSGHAVTLERDGVALSPTDLLPPGKYRVRIHGENPYAGGGSTGEGSTAVAEPQQP